MGWINPSGALRLLHILWQILGKTSEYLFAAVFSTKIDSHHQLNLCYPEYSCEHAPVLERAVSCFRSFIKRQTRGTSSGNEWQRITTNGTTSDNEWQRVTANDSEWQRVKPSDTTSDNEWQRVTTNDNEWQWVAKSGTTCKNGTVTSENEWLQFFL